MSYVILFIYILVIYGVLRLVEFGLTKAWQTYRNRPGREQRFVLKGDEEDFRRPPRPHLQREDRADDGRDTD
jgi:hypothetical protein